MAGQLLTDDDVFGSSELLSDDDVFGGGQPLPAGVKPSAAGAGRGMAPGKTVEQEQSLTGVNARRGTMRGALAYVAAEPVDSTATVLDRPYTQPLPDKLTDAEVADLQAQQTAPWKREQIRKAGEYVTGSKAGVLTAAPKPSVVDDMVAATRAKPLDNSLPAALLQRSGDALAVVEDLRLSGVGGLFQTMELGADVLRLATGTQNDGITADLSDWARRSGELVRKAKSPELRQDAAGLSQILQDEDANVATVLGYLIAHPRLLAAQAVESSPTMLVGAGAGRLAGSLVERLSLSALKAAPATPAVLERIAELSSAGAKVGAVAGETALGAGGVYADVLREGGTPAQAATAAGLTAIGYALVGRATGGGAAGALAAGERRGALRTAMSEGGEEGGQSLAESAGQAWGMGRELDLAQAIKQASNDALVGAVSGGGATMLQGKPGLPGTSAADRALGGALSADIAERDFQPEAIAGYAARASDPRFYSPTFIDPQSTVAPRAPRVEEMPTVPFTPEQTAAMAADAQARQQAKTAADELAAQQQKAAEDAAKQAEKQAAKAAAAPPAAGQTPETVGIRGVARGALAAGAEQALQQAEQTTTGAANAAPATAPTAPAQPAGAAVPARQAGGAQPAATGSPLAAIASRFTSSRARLFEDARIARTRAAELRKVGLSEEADKLETRARQVELSGTELPVLEEPKDGPELRAFNRMADAFEELTGRRPIAYVDRSARASDGFFDEGTGHFLVNLHKPARSVAFTTFHEFQHLVRNMAEKGDAQAQRATQMLDQVWAMIPDAKKRSYAEQYLFRSRIEAGAMTVEQALQSPILKDEMLSDFMGGKADDAGFFRELAAKDPKTFGAFAQRWIDTLAKLVKSLLGRVTGGNKDIEVVAASLERSKLVAEKVLREWAAMNPKLARQQGVSSTIADDAGSTNGQAQQDAGRQVAAPAEAQPAEASARRSGRDDAPGGRPGGSLGQADVQDPVRVSYGVAREGATTAVGYHYSREDRTTLASAMYGSGLAGAEAERLANADPRLRQRVYFYIDRGTGINPEAGVGGRAHRVELRNLYDADEDALRLVRDNSGFSAFELAVLEAGFDGYLTREAGPSGNAVLLGKHAVPVERLGPAAKLQTGRPLKPAAERKLTAPERIAANQKLPGGSITGKRWREYVSAMMPAEFAELQDSPVWGSDERMYRDELARALKREQPRLSRRDSELGAFDPFANDKDPRADDLTDEEVDANSEGYFDEEEALRAEMEDALNKAAAPAPQRIRAPAEAKLRAAGIMAESAYAPLRFTKDKRGSGSASIIAPNGREYSIEYQKDKRGDGYSTLPDYPGGDGVDMGSGYQSGLSEAAAKASLNRIAASIDLHKRGFDLIDAVPYQAGQRVIETWKQFAGKPGAFTFGKDVGSLPSLEQRVRLLQTIGERLAGGAYEVEATPAASKTRTRLVMTDRKTGEEHEAEIETVISPLSQDNRVVMHTQDLQAGSGVGKAVYQIGLTYASAMSLPVNADPSGLTGVNTYRRTEQMLSAALRNGKPNTGKIGVGQRVYGWVQRAVTRNDHEQNLLRLALAGARNAIELAPEAKDLRYDAAQDRFEWRDGAQQDGQAEDYVRQALANKDARVFGLSRSTLARAAITLAAVDGEVQAPESIKAPVLYSTREPDAYAERAEPAGAPNNRARARRFEHQSHDGTTVESGSRHEAIAAVRERMRAALQLANCARSAR